MGFGFENLVVFQKSFSLAMEIFEVTKGFPSEEKYSLTGQIRRSSRSVCSNLAETHRERNYTKRFISKLSDADAECSEKTVWLKFALARKFIKSNSFDKLRNEYHEVSNLLLFMIKNPQ